MKIEDCKVGMRVFEKVYERLEGGWCIPQVGRQGRIVKVYGASVRVKFDGCETFALFTLTHNLSKNGETLPWDRLRHISSVPHIETARRLSMDKIAIVRRVKILDATIEGARGWDWEALAAAVTQLECAVARLSQEAKA